MTINWRLEIKDHAQVKRSYSLLRKDPSMQFWWYPRIIPNDFQGPVPSPPTNQNHHNTDGLCWELVPLLEFLFES